MAGQENLALTEGVYYILLALTQPLHGYGIMQRVIEMEHKNFILEFCERIKDADDERKVYYTHMIFCHLAIWLEENGKAEK